MLQDFVPETTPVIYKDGELFHVGGLCLADIVALQKDYLEELKVVFGEGGEDQLQKLLTQAPTFVAQVILHTAQGEENTPENLAIIQRLPVGVQLAALISIFNLTYLSAEDLGNVCKVVLNTVAVAMESAGLNQTTDGKTSAGSVSERAQSLLDAGIVLPPSADTQ
jgi:hypothetical protein